MSERFVVAESSGYPIAMRDGALVGGRWVTEYMVQDTAYCHRVVWTSLRNPAGMRLGPRGDRREVSGREQAEEICRRFNAHCSARPTTDNIGAWNRRRRP